MAPDQRYCVECGQRLAHARPPFLSDPAKTAQATGSPPPRKPRFQVSPNVALIAGVATLLLALGLGIYIGSLAKGSSAPARQVVAVPSTGPTGTGSTGATAETGTTGGATGKSSKPTGSSSSPAAKASSTKPTAAASKPPNPTVQVGQKGSGPGYQHHEFTGHFFGGENEEDAGEEGEEEGSKGGKKK